MTGRTLGEGTGKVVFWLMLIGIILAFMPMHVSGLLGMARRIPVYYADYKALNQITTVGYALTFIASVIFVAQLLLSYRKPKITSNDPWGINDVQESFEWATSCPPPVYNFEVVPPIPIASQTGNH